MKLNKSKCVFSAAEISFLGHIISVDGLKVDPGKCDAIINMPIPNNKTELQRFLGIINYVGKFIPNLSNITEPLRVLLEKEVEFFMDKPQFEAVEHLKKLVTSTPVLQFFNPNNPIRLRTEQLHQPKSYNMVMFIPEWAKSAFLKHFTPSTFSDT